MEKADPQPLTPEPSAPAFVGQLALQLDTGGLYYGDDTGAGDWTLVTATAAA